MQKTGSQWGRVLQSAFGRMVPALLRKRTAWILIGAMVTPAVWADVPLVHSVTPTTLLTNQTAQVKVLLNNSANSSAATATGLVVPLANLTVSNAASTCVPPGSITIQGSGTATARLVLSGGTVPARGTCEITADVKSATPATYPSDIAAGAVTSSNGSNPGASSVSLVVNGVKPLVGTKSFDKGTLRGGETSKVTITITNPNNLSFGALQASDTLPAQLTIATPSGLATTCGAGTTAWNNGTKTASLANGTIGPNTSCTFSFDVTPADPKAFLSMTAENKIIGSNVQATDSNSNTVQAGGDFSANVNVRTGAQIEKRFAANPVTDGSASSFTLRVTNYNATTLTGISFTDTVPAGITVTSTSGQCNGTSPSTTAGTVTLTNAALAGNSSCTFTVNYTAANTGGGPITANNAPNTFTAPGGGAVSFGGGVVPVILGDSVIVNPNPTNPGNGSGGLSASKQFAKSGGGAPTRNLSAVQTETFNLVVTLRNDNAAGATGVAFSDNLASMGSGFSVAPGFVPPSPFCGGTLTASGTSIGLAGASIAAGGTCVITVPVMVAANAARNTFKNQIGDGTTNTLTGNISGTAHTWAGTDWANVTVGPALSVTKAFTPATIATKDHTVASSLAITINRAAGAVGFTALAFDDAFPTAGAPLTVNTTPLSNTCGGTVNITAQTGAAAGHIVLTGGSMTGAATSCTIVVGFTANQDAVGSFTNSLAAGAVATAEGVKNETAGSGTLKLDAKVATLGLSKSFSPILLGKMGDVSTLTLEISNVDGTPKQTGVTLTDHLPFGMQVAPAPAQSTANCGPSPVFAPVAGATTLTLTGAEIEPGAICKLTVAVTGNAVGNLINVIPAGTITTDPFPGWPGGMTNTGPAQATIQVPAKDASGNPVDLDLAVAITNNATGVCAGGTTTYTVTVTNPGGAAVGGASLVNALPAGITYDSWTVAATGGATASTMAGSGPLNETVSLPKGGKLVYTITATVAPGAVGPLTNTATVQLPAQSPALADANPANNTASDTDPVNTGCVAPPGGATSIPTLSEWGLILLSMLLVGFALRRLPPPSRRRM